MATSHDPPGITIVARIVGSLRARVLDGRLRPEEQLPTVPELAAEYGVSANTIRQALAVLSSQGLVSVKRGVAGGSFVTVPSRAQVSDAWQTGLALMSQNARVSPSSLWEMREILELSAAELAAFRRSDDDLAALRRSLFDPDSYEIETVALLNRDFHATVMRATRNALFELVAAPVRTVLQTRLARDSAPDSFWRAVDREHREILRCIEMRDQIGAREAMRVHLRTARGGSGHVE